MSYYKLLGLDKEPFSTSPDPEFFYDSKEHHAALMRLMIEIRLKRGLSLILGDVGTGKTTLSRKLFRMLKERDDIIFHMILDPTFETEELFLDSLIRTFKITLQKPNPNILDFKEAIKDYLFRTGVEEKKTIVLLIDEAQKLNSLSLEILRVLLNYETNEYKLLQLVLLSQMELLPRIREIKNLMDRLSLKYVINPLDLQGTRAMIEFRLKTAGYLSGPGLFTDDAIREIYHYTQGYPRRIAMICHSGLKELIMHNKPAVTVDIIRELISQEVKISQSQII
ncbi:MAG: AAA family ATPase [Candidatus Omnitrophica bacterium]|nr:AAA family ATPase [Candidatus Omnitrophota bacterium]